MATKKENHEEGFEYMLSYFMKLEDDTKLITLTFPSQEEMDHFIQYFIPSGVEMEVWEK